MGQEDKQLVFSQNFRRIPSITMHFWLVFIQNLVFKIGIVSVIYKVILSTEIHSYIIKPFITVHFLLYFRVLSFKNR